MTRRETGSETLCTADAETSGKTMRSVTIFDTDVGTDDAAAILMLAKLGIEPDYLVATEGNARAEQAIRNAILLKKYSGLEKTAVVEGLRLRGKANDEKNTFHGTDGLAGLSSELEKKLALTDDEKRDHISFETMCEALKDAEEIRYIAVGPVTNLAALIGMEEIRRKISTVYLMGGGIGEFNCSHDTEFNFSKNPEAVREVMTSGLNITLFPLDLTNHQTVCPEAIEILAGYGHYPEFITFLKFNARANTLYNGIHGAVLHDCMPVLYAAGKEDFLVADKKLESDRYGAIRESADGNTFHVAVDVKKTLLWDTLEAIFVSGEGRKGTV